MAAVSPAATVTPASTEKPLLRRGKEPPFVLAIPPFVASWLAVPTRGPDTA